MRNPFKGMFDNFAATQLGYLRQIPDSPKKSFTNPTMEELFNDSVNRLPDPSERNYAKYLAAYADSNWVYSCVSRIIEDFASAPIVLFNEKGEVVENHPALDLLYTVNGQMTRGDLLEWTQAGKELAGNSYWKLDGVEGGGKPTSIWPMIPSMVEVVPSDNSTAFKKGYIYHVNGQQIPYGPEEVIQFKAFNPTSYFYGLAPLAAARLGVDTHLAGSKWNLNFFNHSARYDVAITVPGSLDIEQRSRMRSKWFQEHGGEDNAHGVIFLEKNAKAEIVGVNQKDMDFVEQNKMTREETCSTFKVPPALVGLFEYANYANSREQEKIYWRNTLIPKLNKFCGELNEFYLPLFDKTGKLYFGIQRSEIEALRTDEKERAEYIKHYWGMGAPFNMLIDAFGVPIPHVPGGDVGYIPLSSIEAGTIPAEPPKQITHVDLEKEMIEGEKARTTPTRGQLRAKHHRFMLLASILSKPLKTAMRKYFDVQRDIILGALAKFEGRKPTIASLGLSQQEMNKKLDKLMTPFIRKAVFEGRDSENMMLDTFTGRAAPKVGKKAVTRIDDWINLHAFTWAEQVNDATLKKLEKVLDQAISEGEGIEEISTRVSKTFNMERDYRTLRIAQTEVIASLNEGSLEAYRDNDQVERKGWLPAYDEVTRDTHLIAGRTYGVRGAIPVDANFTVGRATGPAPGEMGDPAEDINCRCTIFPVVKKR